MRALVLALITGFWALMWGLLIHSELRPEEGSLHALPLERVLRQYFEKEQTSTLFLRQGGDTLAHVRLDPRVLAGGSGYELGVLGGLELNAAATVPLRTAFELTLALGPDFHVRSARGGFSRRAPPASGIAPERVDFTADFQTGEGHYRMEEAGEALEQDFTMDQNGMSTLLAGLGLTLPLPQITPAALAPGSVEVTARQARFTLHDEPTDVTVLSVRMGGQTWLEAALSPLGQVLNVKTLWGWVLSAE